ncbi:hypothetical protein HBH70_185520 [Parastagonospora nodorum]|nr:hypothetical protein HBH70_185520 [Parastagonospora nodorum]
MFRTLALRCFDGATPRHAKHHWGTTLASLLTFHPVSSNKYASQLVGLTTARLKICSAQRRACMLVRRVSLVVGGTNNEANA